MPTIRSSANSCRWCCLTAPQRQRPAAGDDRLGHPNGRADLPYRASACGRVLVSRRPAAAVAVARPAGGVHRGRRAGITLRPEWVINGNYHPSSGYEMFAALCARLGRPPKALFTAACGLLEGVLRYMSQHHLLDSNIHLASFDDHYLYDSLSCALIPCSRIIASWPGTAMICSAS